VRSGLNSNLGFSIEDRRENIRRIAELNKILIFNGLIVINCFVSPLNEDRFLARTIIGDADFHEIFIAASLEECETRDVKGLYKKARKGEIKDFTGISAPFETPEKPHLSIETGKQTVHQSAAQLWQYLQPLIKIQTV